MNRIARSVGSIVIGGLLGFASARFFNSPLDLILWAIVGLLIGAAAARWSESIVLGAVYGFVLSFVFILTGYTGTDPVSSKLEGFVALGVIGGLCGLVLGLVGFAARRMLKRSAAQPPAS